MLKSAQKATRGEGGFTLIELLVVMIIIAILMAVAVPTFLKQKQNAVRTQATANIKQIVNAVEACATDNIDGSYTNCNSKAAVLTAEPSLKGIEKGGQTFTVTGGANDYTVVLTLANSQGTFTEAHTATGDVNKDCTSSTAKICNTTAPAGQMW